MSNRLLLLLIVGLGVYMARKRVRTILGDPPEDLVKLYEQYLKQAERILNTLLPSHAAARKITSSSLAENLLKSSGFTIDKILAARKAWARAHTPDETLKIPPPKPVNSPALPPPVPTAARHGERHSNYPEPSEFDATGKTAPSYKEGDTLEAEYRDRYRKELREALAPTWDKSFAAFTRAMRPVAPISSVETVGVMARARAMEEPRGIPSAPPEDIGEIMAELRREQQSRAGGVFVNGERWGEVDGQWKKLTPEEIVKAKAASMARQAQSVVSQAASTSIEQPWYLRTVQDAPLMPVTPPVSAGGSPSTIPPPILVTPSVSSGGSRSSKRSTMPVTS